LNGLRRFLWYNLKPKIFGINLTVGGAQMISEYLQAAMKHARYEILEEDNAYYGEIGICQGVYASADTLEECRTELSSVLEDWLLFRIHEHLPLPEIDGLCLAIDSESAA